MRSINASVFVVLLTACSTSPRPPVTTSSPPQDLHVVISEGGGFTGHWSGYEIDSSGAVFEHSGAPSDAVPTVVGHLSEKDLAVLWSHIRSSGILSKKMVTESGNMTRTITVVSEGNKVQYSWPLVVPARTALDSLYGAIHSVVSNAVAHP